MKESLVPNITVLRVRPKGLFSPKTKGDSCLVPLLPSGTGSATKAAAKHMAISRRGSWASRSGGDLGRNGDRPLSQPQPDGAMMIEGVEGTGPPEHVNDQWSWRALQLATVIRSQAIGGSTTLLVTVPLALALILVGALTSPATRPYNLYDATKSYEHNSSTIPFW